MDAHRRTSGVNLESTMDCGVQSRRTVGNSIPRAARHALDEVSLMQLAYRQAQEHGRLTIQLGDTSDMTVIWSKAVI